MRLAVVVCVIASVTGCNRAGARIPGASLSFPQTSTHFVARAPVPYAVFVALPSDARSAHYGERVAGTHWTGCKTDPFWSTDVPDLIRQRLVAELEAAKLFEHVSQGTSGPNDLVLQTEIDALCSQAIGFLYLRVAGIASLRITVERNGKRLFENRFERVVTDADDEYTGSQVAFIEQAMAVTIADSLRVLFRDLLLTLEREASTWSG
jgi:hypothetical protein